MICTECQSENSLTRLSAMVGWRLEATCPSCGEPNGEGAKFYKELRPTPRSGRRLDSFIESLAMTRILLLVDYRAQV
jgi:hypothetical protein